MSAHACSTCGEVVDTDYHPETCPHCDGELFERHPSVKDDAAFNKWYDEQMKNAKPEDFIDDE